MIPHIKTVEQGDICEFCSLSATRVVVGEIICDRDHCAREAYRVNGDIEDERAANRIAHNISLHHLIHEEGSS